jgi:hypothetical protein
MRRGFAPCFVNYKKGALDSQPQMDSSTTKTGRHDIGKILLKVALMHGKKKIKSKIKVYFNVLGLFLSISQPLTSS